VSQNIIQELNGNTYTVTVVDSDPYHGSRCSWFNVLQNVNAIDELSAESTTRNDRRKD
jgi:hypothetical protein